MGSPPHRAVDNVKERADFSCALFDREVRTVAQAFAMPMHLSSMALAVRQAVRDSGCVLREGESLVFNYVPLGGVHLNDVIVLSPVHFDGELVGYVGNIAHHVDVGGMTAGSIGLSTEIHQEGERDRAHQGREDGPSTSAPLGGPTRQARGSTSIDTGEWSVVDADSPLMDSFA
jgi:N-methylhydantoinase B/oxoprolinase/acetone carboxylase alpha subunit